MEEGKGKEKYSRRRGGGFFHTLIIFRNVLYELNINLTKVKEFSWGATPDRVTNCEDVSVDDVSTIYHIHVLLYMYVWFWRD